MCWTTNLEASSSSPIRPGAGAGGRLALLMALLLPTNARPAEPARVAGELLELVPAEASVVLAVEDLGARSREILSSRLFERFRKVPAVRAWLESDKCRELERTREQFEGFFQVTLPEFRDRILGDAVVLAVQFPDTGPVGHDAAGMLMLKARDPALLRRLIGLINETQKQNGEIASVDDRREGDTPYHLRKYPEGSGRPDEAYVCFPDGTFVLSSTETLVRGVVARRSGVGKGTGFASRATFRRLDSRLPENALARLYIDPRLIERGLKDLPRPQSRGEGRVLDLLERYAGAIEFLGATLVARDDLVTLQVVQTYDQARRAELLGDAGGSANGGELGKRPLKATPGTLALASISLDFRSLYDLVRGLVPEEERDRLGDFETVLSGILLGQDLRERILPALGPRLGAQVDAPTDEAWSRFAESPGRRGFHFPTLLTIDLRAQTPARVSSESTNASAGTTVAQSLDNALKTLLALASLADRGGKVRATLTRRQVAGTSVVSLDPAIPLAYAVDRRANILILGTSGDHLIRFLEQGGETEAARRFDRLRAAAFPGAESFACIDLAALRAMIGRNRGPLTRIISGQQGRPDADVAHDLDQLLALAGLFDAGFLTSHFDRRADAAHHVLGLLPRPAGRDEP